jgi:hypothetical protein
VREFIINPANQDSVDDFVSYLDGTLRDSGLLKVTVKQVKDRSLSQNALLHIWFREYAAMRLNKPLKKITQDDTDSIKLLVKQACYGDMKYDWLCQRVTNIDTGVSAFVLRSTSRYDKGEMFMFMEWFQAFAAQKGLLLESMGEYGRLKDETNQ